MKQLFIISLLFSLQSCFKELHEQALPAMCPVQFYTTLKPITGVQVFINGHYLTKLPYSAETPICGEGINDLLWAAPNRFYRVSYFGNELVPDELIDTMIMVKENTCTVINLCN